MEIIYCITVWHFKSLVHYWHRRAGVNIVVDGSRKESVIVDDLDIGSFSALMFRLVTGMASVY